ncbi:MAG: response regulator [Thermodesulfovibrionales bacterium]|nr:response regulator [Thermodesulfovibrionales bacterium]
MKRILIIDDEPVILLGCKKSLTNEGFTVDCAESGKEGIELFDKNRHDLVVVDSRMPEMDGFEVLKRIKLISPKTPVVVMSGYNYREHVKEAITCGACGYLSKPFTPEDLICMIVESLNG